MRNPKILVLDLTEDLSLQVERTTAGLRPRPAVVWCATFDLVDGVTADVGPFDVLVAGPLVSKDAGYQNLRELRARAPETQVILALDHWRSTDLRNTVRTGALDLLRLPVSDDALLDAVQQALDASAALAPARGEGRHPGEAIAERPGTVIAVVSGSGGSGKTFLATNLAYHLQFHADMQTCLIDLDLQFGELSTALRMKPRHTIYDLVTADAEGDDLARQLEEHLERHESGIRVLAAPDDPALADAIDAAEVARVIDAARSRFDYVIVDTPTALNEAVLVAVEQADQVFVMATLDLPSVRNLGVMLATLKKLKVPSDRARLVLNKVEPDVGIDVARVEQYFPQGFSIVIPYGREVNRSLNMGQPLLAYAPRKEVGKALGAGLAASVLAGAEVGADEVAAVAASKRGRLSLLHRKPA
ncbi:MAG: AAA family ATPase [Actinomycetota bacterium]|nr:AAA family ATPase [Actinomycetota bacterium]